jgi:hypothetical protein
MMEISIRIDEINPVHARISVFTSGMRRGIPTTSRGLSGELCIDAEVLIEYVAQTKPNWIQWDISKLGLAPNWLKNDYRFRDEDGLWKRFRTY